MMRFYSLAFLATCFFLHGPGSIHGENWPQWRGPNNDGISREKNLPTTFGQKENVIWRTPLPGPAGSTPVVWEDRIFLSSVDGDNLVLLCFNSDGKQLWRRVVSQGNRDVRNDEGNSASNSPSTDGEHVWVMFTNGALACYDFDGREAWKVDLQQRFGKFNIAFGMTSTPVLDGERLYVQLIHGDGNPRTREATVAALDKSTGETIWQVGRPSEAHSENEHSYASPMLYRDDEREFLLTHGADYIVAHRLDDGTEIWRCGGLHPPTRYDPTLRFVSSPLAIPGLIVVPSAKRGVTLALRPDCTGDITERESCQFWRFGTTPDVPSPLAVDDMVYLCRENGNLIALDRESGEQFYEERTHVDRHRASPLYADGKIYLSARDGTISVCKPGKQFELLASNKMGEDISSSPVVSNGRLYIRTFKALYAIGSPRTGG